MMIIHRPTQQNPSGTALMFPDSIERTKHIALLIDAGIVADTMSSPACWNFDRRLKSQDRDGENITGYAKEKSMTPKPYL